MPSKIVALKVLIFAHSSFNVWKRDTTQKYEYSRKQEQLEKNYIILQYIVSAFDKK